MITIELNQKGDIDLYSHYAYRKRLHDIPGSEFAYYKKCWTAPIDSLDYIESNFKGEIYYKTPRWKIKGEKKPEYKETYYYPKQDPPDLLVSPYDYQKKGISFMIDRLLMLGFVLNADAMGLGKTIQAIGTLKWFIENRSVKRILIICKKSIKTQWESEIKRFTGTDIPIFITRDNKKKREKTYKEASLSDSFILITNYHNYLNDTETIKTLDTEFCIIDEAHSIKAHNGVMNRNIRQVTQGKYTILLTGTPVMASPEDIYGIVNLATDRCFGTFPEYEKQFLVIEFGIYGRQVIGARHLDDLHRVISSFMIRRTAEDVDLELPQRTVTVINEESDTVQKGLINIVDLEKEDITARKEKLLEKYRNESRIPESVKGTIEKINEIEKMFIATEQFIADDPYCFKVLDPDKGINRKMLENIPEKYRMSNKTEAVLDLVEDIVSGDEKVIIFTHFSSAAKLLAKRIKEKYGKNNAYKVCMYTGSESDDIREKNIWTFKNDPESHILIGTDAMAEGLNLQIARYLINYEQADTYAQREQRIGRIERIGSLHKNVIIYDMITEGSFDETKLNKLEKDKIIANAITNTKKEDQC